MKGAAQLTRGPAFGGVAYYHLKGARLVTALVQPLQRVLATTCVSGLGLSSGKHRKHSKEAGNFHNDDEKEKAL